MKQYENEYKPPIASQKQYKIIKKEKKNNNGMRFIQGQLEVKLI